MKCKCGHGESEHKELQGKQACFVIFEAHEEYNEYCQCMNFEVDELPTLRAENARLTALVNELSEDATQNGIAFRNMLHANKQQAAKIAELRQTVHTAYGHTCPLEDCKSLICSSTNGSLAK